MAEENREKLVLKPGVVAGFLRNFGRTADGEGFQFIDLMMSDKVVDQLPAKAVEEAKDVQNMDISMNSIVEVGTLSVCT